MEPSAEKPVAAFFRKLGTDHALLAKWLTDPWAATGNQGMTDEERQMLVDGDIKGLRTALKADDAAGAPNRWIVIWVV